MEENLIWWPSPAKLNLFLHINGRDERGYHQLQSLFQMLDYGDELAFDVSETDKIYMDEPIDGVKDEENLIIRAAMALKKHSGVKKGARILIRKRLPMGGGIGGGSSNAATALVALNHLWQCGLDLKTLSEIGLKLGADVPIFVHGKTAFAEGVGEVITPTDNEGDVFLVVFPGCHVSTAAVFSEPLLPRDTPKITWQDYQFDNTHNDCQKIVCERYPKVANLLRWLLEYAPSRMTGTGACLFAIFNQAEEARQVLKTLPEGTSGFVARGVNQSPLYSRLNEIKNT